MKKLNLSILALLTSCTLLFSQQEATIVYSMEVDGLPPEAAAMMAGMENKVFIKGDKTRSEVITPFTSQISITNNKTKETVILMDMMGQKYMLKEKTEESKDQPKPTVKIKQLGEKKVVAGYNCQNAEVSIKSTKEGKESEVVTIVWYTKEIKSAAYEGDFKGLGGVPMEYEMNNQGQKIKMTCKSYSTDAVPDSKFDIPEGYTLTTKEDLKKMMGGMGK